MANQQYRSQTTIQATESKDKATQERQTHCEHKIIRSMGYSTDIPRCVHCGATEKEAQELAEQFLARAYSESLYGQLANVQKPGQSLVPPHKAEIEEMESIRRRLIGLVDARGAEVVQKAFIERREKMAADVLNRAFAQYEWNGVTPETAQCVQALLNRRRV
jgi:hypothetical protein